MDSNDAAVIAIRDEYEVLYPLVSGFGGGGNAVSNAYGIPGSPHYMLIRPDRSILDGGDNHIQPVDIIDDGVSPSACPGEMPLAGFIGEPLVIPAGDSVFFTNLSNEFATYWYWEFPGSETEVFEGENPGWIIYNEPGLYNVKQIVTNNLTNVDSVIKSNYVDVKIAADTLPKADFTANQIIVVAGNSVNYTDLTTEHPYVWQWNFYGAVTTESVLQHPSNIQYNVPGTYDVRLIVMNSHGFDTVVKEDYIHVIEDGGLLPPIARFTADHRLIKRGTYVNFVDHSENYPTNWNWVYYGGTPNTSNMQIYPGGIKYNSTGKFDVILSVSNANGGNALRKKDYIVVYDSFISQICDTISNFRPGEIPKAISLPGGTGYLGGQNSHQIRVYADHFNFHTYNQISGIIIPVMKLNYSNQNAYIRIITWDGTDSVPTVELSSQKVMLRDLQQNFNQVIMFNSPLEVDGPFYLGYSINYASGDQFVVGLASNRGVNGDNTFWVKKGENWLNTRYEYDIATSTGIRPFVCLVGVDDIMISERISIYPNPATDILNIYYEDGFRTGDFAEIFDISGKILVQKPADGYSNEINLNLEGLSNGVYYLRIFTEGRLIIEKVSVMN